MSAAEDVVATVLRDEYGPQFVFGSDTAVLAALSEHGFTVIRTDSLGDARTWIRDGALMLDLVATRTASGYDRPRYEQLLRQAESLLVVLRGDPPQPRHLTNSAGGHHNPREQAILGGDPSL